MGVTLGVRLNLPLSWRTSGSIVVKGVQSPSASAHPDGSHSDSTFQVYICTDIPYALLLAAAVGSGFMEACYSLWRVSRAKIQAL